MDRGMDEQQTSMITKLAWPMAQVSLQTKTTTHTCYLTVR